MQGLPEAGPVLLPLNDPDYFIKIIFLLCTF